jgi:probable phosphoglycerate mutase
MRRTVYIARHGETDWNAAGRWQGHTDIPLNDNGRAQAKGLAGRLWGAGIVAVVTSDLVRARETGQIVALELGVPLAYADAALRERSFGVFEGLTREECETLHAGAWQAWLDHKRPPEGAEEHEALTSRIVEAIGRVATDVAQDDGPALVVTHGGALRAIVTATTGKAPPPLRNAALWRVVWKGGLVAAKELEEPEE